jgi:hypothetical protein
MTAKASERVIADPQLPKVEKGKIIRNIEESRCFLLTIKHELPDRFLDDLVFLYFIGLFPRS